MDDANTDEELVTKYPSLDAPYLFDAGLFSKSSALLVSGLDVGSVLATDENGDVPIKTSDLQASLSNRFLNLEAHVEEAKVFKSALVDQLCRNGHPEALRDMTELELLSYIVNALGGVVLK